MNLNVFNDHTPNCFFGPATDEQIRAADVIIGCSDKCPALILSGQHILDRIERTNVPERPMICVIPVENDQELAGLATRVERIKLRQRN